MVFRTKLEIKALVIKLLNDGKTYKEIQKTLHVTPNFISIVAKEEFGQDNILTNGISKPSKNTLAIKLFSESKTPLSVSIELDMDATEVNRAYSDYIQLNNLTKFNYLLHRENTKKIAFIVNLSELLNEKGINNAKSMNKIFYDIEYHNLLKQEINYFSHINNDLNCEIQNKQNQIIELNKILKRKQDWIRFLKFKDNELKKDLDKKQKFVNNLKKLCERINNLEIFQDLQTILINYIKNILLSDDEKIKFIFLAICDAYKDDPKMREYILDYSIEFKNKKLSIDTLEERVDYFYKNGFWNYVPKCFAKLSEVYSKFIFDSVLRKYFASKMMQSKPN